MHPSPHVTVRVDLARVRSNTEAVRARVGVPVIAVIKADAYGLGASEVIGAIDDLVAGYCVFSIREAIDADVFGRTGKRPIVLSPPAQQTMEPDDWLAAGARPCVTTADEALQLADANPLLSVDTGMQRFACAPAQVDEVLAVGACREAITHATTLEQVEALKELAGGRGLMLHAAGSSLLDEPAAWLNAVRPGLALYRGAVRVSARLVETRESSGAVGYSRWVSSTGRHGIILCGYCNGLRPGVCSVNGQRRRIPEVGMQSAYVELGPMDRVGDEVVLLGDEVTEQDVSQHWQTSPHEVLVRLAGAGARVYVK